MKRTDRRNRDRRAERDQREQNDVRQTGAKPERSGVVSVEADREPATAEQRACDQRRHARKSSGHELLPTDHEQAPE